MTGGSNTNWDKKSSMDGSHKSTIEGSHFSKMSNDELYDMAKALGYKGKKTERKTLEKFLSRKQSTAKDQRDLREELKKNNLSTKGSKKQLQERLEKYNKLGRYERQTIKRIDTLSNAELIALGSNMFSSKDHKPSIIKSTLKENLLKHSDPEGYAFLINEKIDENKNLSVVPALQKRLQEERENDGYTYHVVNDGKYDILPSGFEFNENRRVQKGDLVVLELKHKDSKFSSFVSGKVLAVGKNEIKLAYSVDGSSETTKIETFSVKNSNLEDITVIESRVDE